MAKPETQRSVEPRELIELLSPALGEQVARRTIQEALTALQLPSLEVSVAQAIQVLEHVAQTPGLVGITGRFAISRAILSWGVG